MQVTKKSRGTTQNEIKHPRTNSNGDAFVVGAVAATKLGQKIELEPLSHSMLMVPQIPSHYKLELSIELGPVANL